ncbi:MAG: NlpC/P60 family protein [Pseudomonadota bacterium]
MSFDKRLTPARDDIAADHLEGILPAPRYVAGMKHRVSAGRTELLRQPGGGLDTELLHGEDFVVYDVADGWAWGQAALDSYVGYVDVRDLVARGEDPTHRVATLGAQVYRAPELKTLPSGRFPFGARLYVADTTDTHAQIGPASWVPLRQLAPLALPAPDWVAVAETFLGVPYVWGGRSSEGLDCSALVQLSLQAAGQTCPRDSDLQANTLGNDLAEDTRLQRGDLIFWQGHVGIMRDADTLLHANAFHMSVIAEPLDQAIERIGANEFGAVVRRARLDPDATGA